MGEAEAAQAEEAKLPRLVVISLDDDDNFTIQVQGIMQAAVPTLLRLAVKQVEQSFGIGADA